MIINLSSGVIYSHKQRGSSLCTKIGQSSGYIIRSKKASMGHCVAHSATYWKNEQKEYINIFGNICRR